MFMEDIGLLICKILWRLRDEFVDTEFETMYRSFRGKPIINEPYLGYVCGQRSS